MKQNLTFKQRPKERRAGIAHRGVLDWKQASAVFFHELWFLKSWPCGSIVSGWVTFWAFPILEVPDSCLMIKPTVGLQILLSVNPCSPSLGHRHLWVSDEDYHDSPRNCMNRSFRVVLELHRPLGAQGEGPRLRIPWLGSFMFLWKLDEAFKNSLKVLQQNFQNYYLG